MPKLVGVVERGVHDHGEPRAAKPAEEERDGYQIDQRVHAGRANPTEGALLSAPSAASGGAPLSLNELATTMIEEVDMATAAISGVAWPRIAIGTAMTL